MRRSAVYEALKWSADKRRERDRARSYPALIVRSPPRQTDLHFDGSTYLAEPQGLTIEKVRLGLEAVRRWRNQEP